MGEGQTYKGRLNYQAEYENEIDGISQGIKQTRLVFSP